MVPPVASSLTRGKAASCAARTASDATATKKTTTLTRMHFGMVRIQVPVEERPHAVPGIALLARVLGLPRLRIHAPIERVASRRVVVHHGFGELRLACAQRVH